MHYAQTAFQTPSKSDHSLLFGTTNLFVVKQILSAYPAIPKEKAEPMPKVDPPASKPQGTVQTAVPNNEENAAPSYNLSDQIGFKLRLANQKHLELFASMMPDATPTQFAILARLHETGPLSHNHLGRQVGMDAATTKGVVDRLAQKGWITRTVSKTDLRRLDISLTSAGQDFIASALPLAAKISAQTTQNLTQRELDRLLSLLGKL
jgi:DNA-binding MarR family transcriptional regulator